MSLTTEFTETQLAAARAKAWHQDGEALITLEATREWLNRYGMVLFAPKAQLATPAPSLVEATLGAANAAPTLAQTELAKSLVSRMVAEGSALPLNLLGVPGDVPDFVVSAQVYSYVFTMRGDKAWKLPPTTSGAIKVSPLGLGVYESLKEKGALTAAELANELGREVTETAILRALVELWSQLRVIPLVQAGQGVTLWELTARRFTKAIKAGANAGQPTALSALVSLYLAQALAATEDEIETFLSPLTARSRVREVLHALIGARQLETSVLEGKTLLHIPGELPEFPVVEVPVVLGEDGLPVEPVVPFEKPKKVGTGRITKFESETRTAGEFRGKPVNKFGAGPGMVKPSARFGARADGKSEPQRRPFKKAEAGAKPTFTKPWEEEKKPRVSRAKADSGAPDAFKKFRKPEAEDRKPLGDREQAGLPAEDRVFSKPKFERESRERDFAKSQAGASEGGEGAAWKKPRSVNSAKGFDKSADGEKPAYKAKSFGAGAKTYGAKAGGAKTYGAKAGGFGAKKPYAAKPYAAKGIDANAEGERETFKPRSYERPGGGFLGKKPYKAREAEGGSGFGEGKPAFGAKKPYAAKAAFGAKKPYAARGEDGRFSKPAFGDKKPAFGAKRPYTPRSEEGGESTYPKRPSTPREPREGGFSKPAYGAKKPYAAKPYAAKAEGAPGDFPKRTYKPKSEGAEGEFPKRPYTPRSGSSRGEGGFSKSRFGGRGGGRASFTPVDENAPRVFEKKPYKPRAADADQRKWTKAPFTAEELTPVKKKSSGRPSGKPRYGGKPGGKFSK